MAPVQKRPRILLVEDSFDDVFFFKRVVKQTGIDCTLVHLADGAAAMAELERISALPALATDRPDLVFLDLKLPIFDGFELLTWIRERQLWPPLRVAILSGSADEADVGRAETLGADMYFAKPLSVEQLRSRLLACALNERHGSSPSPGLPNN